LHISLVLGQYKEEIHCEMEDETEFMKTIRKCSQRWKQRKSSKTTTAQNDRWHDQIYVGAKVNLLTGNFCKLSEILIKSIVTSESQDLVKAWGFAEQNKTA